MNVKDALRRAGELPPGVKFARMAMTLSLVRSLGGGDPTLALLQVYGDKRLMRRRPWLVQAMESMAFNPSHWGETAYSRKLAEEFIEFLRPSKRLRSVPFTIGVTDKSGRRLVATWEGKR
jgi:hypothetical protein